MEKPAIVMPENSKLEFSKKSEGYYMRYEETFMSDTGRTLIEPSLNGMKTLFGDKMDMTIEDNTIIIEGTTDKPSSFLFGMAGEYLAQALAHTQKEFGETEQDITSEFITKLEDIFSQLDFVLESDYHE